MSDRPTVDQVITCFAYLKSRPKPVKEFDFSFENVDYWND